MEKYRLNLTKSVNNSSNVKAVANKIANLSHTMNIQAVERACKKFYAENGCVMLSINNNDFAADFSLSDYEEWLGK